jgi:hypothetical protein
MTRNGLFEVSMNERTATANIGRQFGEAALLSGWQGRCQNWKLTPIEGPLKVILSASKRPTSPKS